MTRTNRPRSGARPRRSSATWRDWRAAVPPRPRRNGAPLLLSRLISSDSFRSSYAAGHPRVLALLGSPHAEACAAAFRAAAEDAPSSSFKDHGDQLVALLSAYGDSNDARAKAICEAVRPVVERLARSAPSSVRDALRFASEKLTDTTLIRAARDACRDDIAEAFVLACEHEPEKRLAEGLDV